MTRSSFFAAALAFTCATSAQGQDGLKVYISADMEGVVGAVTGDQLGPTGFEYQRFRRFLTNEVNAAIAAAREMGATEILVSDSHGNGENLLIEELPQDIENRRNNVEASIFQLSYRNRNGKTRYRGQLPHQLWATCRGLWMNLIRIKNYLAQPVQVPA